MKIRFGFVTNSSSVSFCVVGKHFQEFGDLINSIQANVDGELHPRLKDALDTEDSWGVEAYAKEKGIQVNIKWGGDYGGYYVGLQIETMRDDETMGEFKTRAAEALCALGVSNRLADLVVDNGIQIHTVGYFNG